MDFYQQTSEYTGAAAALLMALHARSPESWPLNREKEFRIWMQSANLPTRSSSIYALGTIAQKEGFQATIVVGEKEYDYPDYRFKRYKKVEIDDAKYCSKLHSKLAGAAGVKIHERDVVFADVKKALLDGCFVLLRVNAGIFRDQKSTSKFVLVHAFSQNKYTITDPEQGEMQLDPETLEAAFETLVTKKKRDHRMLILR